MPYSLKEVIAKSRRANDLENKRLHPFASRLSVYFSWAFINLRLTPNQVTGIFFFVGLIGAFFLLGISPFYTIVSYILFRLHIIIDVSDGEVARFTKKFSINGSYWDSMIHAFLYPMFFACMCTAQFELFNNVNFLFVGMFGILTSSLLMASKNNYYRAMLFNKVSVEEQKAKNNKIPKTGIKFQLFSGIAEILSFEGLFVGYIILSFLSIQDYTFILLAFYALVFGLFAFIKFYMLTMKGYYTTRS